MIECGGRRLWSGMSDGGRRLQTQTQRRCSDCLPEIPSILKLQWRNMWIPRRSRLFELKDIVQMLHLNDSAVRRSFDASVCP